MKRFVVISGLPGSGKSTLASRLAPELCLPVNDKDVVLEELFESRGDCVSRRELSRESDLIFRDRALSTEAAILVSHWRLPGMLADSGTPTEWLLSHTVVNVHCVCTPEIAAQRFFERKRHPGHRDGERSLAEILESIRAVDRLGSLEIGTRLDVDTSGLADLSTVVERIGPLLNAHGFYVRKQR